jgi:hypothetical protein
MEKEDLEDSLYIKILTHVTLKSGRSQEAAILRTIMPISFKIFPARLNHLTFF